MSSIPIITVDGPSGTGKGTLSGILANWLNWHLLDSGALYRLTGLSAKKLDLDFDNASSIGEMARSLKIHFSPPRPGQDIGVYLDDAEVSTEIRNEDCGKLASKVAVYPEVRKALFQRQRDFWQEPGLIADGRDMGTVVFPEAPLKVFLTATPEKRAERRYKQLKQQGISVNLAALSADIAARDQRDSGRNIAPLKPAEDATIIDTSDIGIDEVVFHVVKEARRIYPDLPELPGQGD